MPDEKKYNKWIENNEELMQGMITSNIFRGRKQINRKEKYCYYFVLITYKIIFMKYDIDTNLDIELLDYIEKIRY